MLRLDRVIKPWREADALDAQINLFGFWNETAFLTKSGDLGMVLRVYGIDYESLDNSEQDYAVKRLESAFKCFGAGFHVYRYLFKSNLPNIPFETYDDPLIDATISGDTSGDTSFRKLLPWLAINCKTYLFTIILGIMDLREDATTCILLQYRQNRT